MALQGAVWALSILSFLGGAAGAARCARGDARAGGNIWSPSAYSDGRLFWVNPYPCERNCTVSVFSYRLCRADLLASTPDHVSGVVCQDLPAELKVEGIMAAGDVLRLSIESPLSSNSYPMVAFVEPGGFRLIRPDVNQTMTYYSQTISPDGSVLYYEKQIAFNEPLSLCYFWVSSLVSGSKRGVYCVPSPYPNNDASPSKIAPSLGGSEGKAVYWFGSDGHSICKREITADGFGGVECHHDLKAKPGGAAPMVAVAPMDGITRVVWTAELPNNGGWVLCNANGTLEEPFCRPCPKAHSLSLARSGLSAALSSVEELKVCSFDLGDYGNSTESWCPRTFPNATEAKLSVHNSPNGTSFTFTQNSNDPPTLCLAHKGLGADGVACLNTSEFTSFYSFLPSGDWVTAAFSSPNLVCVGRIGELRNGTMDGLRCFVDNWGQASVTEDGRFFMFNANQCFLRLDGGWQDAAPLCPRTTPNLIVGAINPPAYSREGGVVAYSTVSSPIGFLRSTYSYCVARAAGIVSGTLSGVRCFYTFGGNGIAMSGDGLFAVANVGYSIGDTGQMCSVEVARMKWNTRDGVKCTPCAPDHAYCRPGLMAISDGPGDRVIIYTDDQVNYWRICSLPSPSNPSSTPLATPSCTKYNGVMGGLVVSADGALAALSNKGSRAGGLSAICIYTVSTDTLGCTLSPNGTNGTGPTNRDWNITNLAMDPSGSFVAYHWGTSAAPSQLCVLRIAEFKPGTDQGIQCRTAGANASYTGGVSLVESGADWGVGFSLSATGEGVSGCFATSLSNWGGGDPRGGCSPPLAGLGAGSRTFYAADNSYRWLNGEALCKQGAMGTSHECQKFLPGYAAPVAASTHGKSSALWIADVLGDGFAQPGAICVEDID